MVCVRPLVHSTSRLLSVAAVNNTSECCSRRLWILVSVGYYGLPSCIVWIEIFIDTNKPVAAWCEAGHSMAWGNGFEAEFVGFYRSVRPVCTEFR